MKTFYAWLIANIESITTVLVIIVFEIIWLSHSTTSMGNKVSVALGGTLIIMAGKTLMGGLPSKNTIIDAINLFLIIATYTLLFAFEHINFQHEYTLARNLYFATLGIALVSLVFAIMAAIFTFHNTGIVASHRMLYPNSSVSLFEIKWRYTLNRFIMTFNSLSSLGLIVIVGQLLLQSTMLKLAF